MNEFFACRSSASETSSVRMRAISSSEIFAASATVALFDS